MSQKQCAKVQQQQTDAQETPTINRITISQILCVSVSKSFMRYKMLIMSVSTCDKLCITSSTLFFSIIIFIIASLLPCLVCQILFLILRFFFLFLAASIAVGDDDVDVCVCVFFFALLIYFVCNRRWLLSLSFDHA